MKRSLHLILLLLPFYCFSQAPGNQYVRTMTNVYGGGTTDFLLFKPADSNSAAKHPLIIFLHGGGEVASTDPNVIASVTGSIPYYCAHGASMQFTTGGVSSTFYVMSPKKYAGGNGAWDMEPVKNMIAYARANLNVDTNRIYLTGLSLGGGGTWHFITDSLSWDYKIAAAAPVAGTQEMVDSNYCSTIGTSHMPVWAFHCEDDGTVGVGATQHAWWDEVLHCSSDSPRLRTTYYTSGGHSGAWINAYDTGHITRTVDSSNATYGTGPSNASFTANPNLYEWFLSHNRGNTTPPSVTHASYSWPGCGGSLTINPGALSGYGINLQPGDTLVFSGNCTWSDLNVDHINGTATDTIVFKFLPGSLITTSIPWALGRWDSVSFVKVVGAHVDRYAGIFAQIDNYSHDISFWDGVYRGIVNNYMFVLGDKWSRYYFDGTKNSTIYGIGWYNNVFDSAVDACFIQGNADSTWNILLDISIVGNTFKNMTNTGSIPPAAVSMKAFHVTFTNNRCDSLLANSGATTVHTGFVLVHGWGDFSNNLFSNSYGNDLRMVPMQFNGLPGYSGPDAKYAIYNNISHHKLSFSFVEMSPNNGVWEIEKGMGYFAPCKSEIYHNTVYSTHRSSYNGDYYGMVVDLFSDSAAIRHNVIVAPEIDRTYDVSGRGGYVIDFPSGPKICDTGNNRVYQTAAAAGLDTLNWQLIGGSPLIDASDGASPTASYDYYHVSRPQGSAADIGAIEYPSGGSAAAPLILYNRPLTLIEDPDNLLITPNPVTDRVQINNSKTTRCAVLYGATGQKLLIQQPSGNGGSFQMDMSRLPAGVYLLQITDMSGNVRTVKLLKN